jgi:hypothetical protein
VSQVTICIPNLNGGPFMEMAFMSARRHMPGSKIWISDHGSSDGSVEFCKKSADRYLQIQPGTGSHGVLIDEWSLSVKTDFFLLMDCDVEILKFPIGKAISLMVSDESISAIDGSSFEIGGIPYTDNGQQYIQQSRIDPSFALIRTAHSRELVKAGDSWGFRTAGNELFDTGAWFKRKTLSIGRNVGRCSEMKESHIHYGNVSWARNPAASFETLKKYVSNRELVETRLKTIYGQ